MPVFSLARLPQVFGDAYELLVNTAWIMLGWSLVDYVVEWRQWESRLKMSKQESAKSSRRPKAIRRLKGRIRSLQRQIAPTHAARGCEEGKRGHYKSDPLCRGALLRLEHDGSAEDGWRRGRDLVAAQIRRRSALGRSTAGGESNRLLRSPSTASVEAGTEPSSRTVCSRRRNFLAYISSVRKQRSG